MHVPLVVASLHAPPAGVPVHVSSLVSDTAAAHVHPTGHAVESLAPARVTEQVAPVPVELLQAPPFANAAPFASSTLQPLRVAQTVVPFAPAVPSTAKPEQSVEVGTAPGVLLPRLDVPSEATPSVSAPQVFHGTCKHDWAASAEDGQDVAVAAPFVVPRINVFVVTVPPAVHAAVSSATDLVFLTASVNVLQT